MSFFTLPKYVTSKSGQIIQRTDRENRFRVQFTLGSMGSCVTDAQRVCDLTVERTVSMIRINWTRGQRADGTFIGQRKKTRRIWGFGKEKFTVEMVATYENMVLTGVFKTPKEEPGDSYHRHIQIKRIKEWMKSVKDKYKLKGHTYKPTSKKRTGNWSGMIMDTIKADPIKIMVKNGKVPTKVSMRITVTTKRQDAVLKLHMMRMRADSMIMKENQKVLQQAARSTGVFRSWQSGDLRETDLMAVWNKFKAANQGVARAISVAAKIGRMI